MMIRHDGLPRAVCAVCGPAGCVDGPGHAVVLCKEPENRAEALAADASGRVLGWFRADPLAPDRAAVATGGGLRFLASPATLEALAARALVKALPEAAGAPPALKRALVGALRRRVDDGEPGSAEALAEALPVLAARARLEALDLSDCAAAAYCGLDAR